MGPVGTKLCSFFLNEFIEAGTSCKLEYQNLLYSTAQGCSTTQSNTCRPGLDSNSGMHEQRGEAPTRYQVAGA